MEEMIDDFLNDFTREVIDSVHPPFDPETRKGYQAVFLTGISAGLFAAGLDDEFVRRKVAELR